METTEKDNKPIIVTIRCIAYNHEPYIRQCLEGFVMQKTNFRFEAIVHDDASTDGTIGIIREFAEMYPDIIKPIFETENQYSKHDGSLRRIMDAHTFGKYIALCEGDDYWIDPLKLQKQVDYMEKDNQCKLCYTRSYIINSSSSKLSNKILGKQVLSYTDLLLHNTIPTLTVMVRQDVYSEYVRDCKSFPENEWRMGDYPTWLYVANKAKVFMLNDICAVYRILPESASHGDYNKTVLFVESAKKIALFFDHLYCNDKNKDLISEKYNRDLFVLSFTHKKYENAILYYNKYKKKQFRDRFISFIITIIQSIYQPLRKRK